MVRQRKSHTRLKKGSAALVEACREVLSAEGHPEDGRSRVRPGSAWPSGINLCVVGCS